MWDRTDEPGWSAGMKGSGNFGIGSKVWPGLGKLIEEAGEVQQIAAKLISTDGEDRYWDGTDLRAELCGELGDLLAAIAFVSEANKLEAESTLIEDRFDKKFPLFNKWHAEGGH